MKNKHSPDRSQSKQEKWKKHWLESHWPGWSVDMKNARDTSGVTICVIIQRN